MVCSVTATEFCDCVCVNIYLFSWKSGCSLVLVLLQRRETVLAFRAHLNLEHLYSTDNDRCNNNFVVCVYSQFIMRVGVCGGGVFGFFFFCLFALIILLATYSSFTLSERNWVNIKQASSECCNFFQYWVNSEYVVMIFITACIRGNSYVSVRAGVSGLHECKEFFFNRTNLAFLLSAIPLSPACFVMRVYCADGE